DFLSDAGAAIQSTDTLLDQQADDVHTLLSAVVTNQQTCFDGLQQAAAGSWSGGGFDALLANSTKLYSLSLSLFTRAWVPTARPAARHPHKGGKAPPHHGHGGKHGKKAPAARWGLFDVTNDEMVQQMAMEGPERTVSVNAVVTVDQSGAGNFTTVGAAVAAAPRNLNGSGGYYLIHVLAGVYEENVTVPKHSKYIMMVGDGIDKTVITGNQSVWLHGLKTGLTTFQTATFAVLGQGFVAMNMTFRNTAGPENHQAVALQSSADRSAFYGCSFEAFQDTLYTHSHRQFYRDCDIYGTVDYVFGNAGVLFQGCNFYSRLPMQGQSNTVTAPSSRAARCSRRQSSPPTPPSPRSPTSADRGRTSRAPWSWSPTSAASSTPWDGCRGPGTCTST
ncbi:unnamed protein product, partial [Urochloa humidicola]